MQQCVVLIPAHNEAESIADTIEAVLSQERTPDKIIVIANGCTDRTAEIARTYHDAGPIEVLELPELEHKKSEALNIGWILYASRADVVVCLDADTILPPNAIKDWMNEFAHDILPGGRNRELSNPLGGSSSKFTMRGNGFLTRMQRAEFAKWTDTALVRRRTSVLAGTGCAISGEALRQVVKGSDRVGPWSYDSQVEDFELTYQIRKLGYRCQVSPTVRAYTDSMKTVRALWGQRMKWQVGTIEDLLSIGVNKFTLFDWYQQLTGISMALLRILWISTMTYLAVTGMMTFQILGMLIIPLLFVLLEFHAALRIPHRDRRDVLYALVILPSEIFAMLRAGWFIAAWREVLVGKITGKRRDRWQLQYAAETR